jgi:ABC-type transport system involved in multi-copper enzyme maturation permease subunit
MPISEPLRGEDELALPAFEDVPEARPASTQRIGGERRRVSRPRIDLRASMRNSFAGLTAIGVKELRGRMRGRRAFVILTVYLLLLAGFAWMMELILEEEKSRGFAGSAAFASAEIGAGVFTALILLETLLVVALAPAFTAGAISMEREKQTLDLLATTPISSLSIVVAKLFSALTYLFILIFASIPLTAMVFVFGGVAPDDVIKAYVVLVTTAIGLGSVGLFFSALLKRTQAATIATYFGVMFATLGTFFILFFWNTMSGGGRPGEGFGPLRGRPPEALVYLNPYFAQADVICGVENGVGERCQHVAFVSDQPIFGTLPSRPRVDPGSPPISVPGGPAIDPAFPDVGFDDVVVGQPLGVVRDSLWPKSAVMWLVVSFVLIVLSVQLVSPTRRWHPHLPGFLRRPARRVSP